MYSGILQLDDDSLAQEIITASDYFQMTKLKKDLDLKYKMSVVPSNVLSFGKVADMHNLPLLREACDRIQLLKFSEVVKHEEFHKLSKEEVFLYFKKCKPYSGISSDDFLHAAVMWMAENERFPELIRQIDLKKCSQSALRAARNHPAVPIVTLLKNCKKGKQKKQSKQQTLAYVTVRECIVNDENKQRRILDKYEEFNYETFSNRRKICTTPNGYMFVKEERFNSTIALASINKYDRATRKTTRLPGVEVKKPGVGFSIIHKNRMYIVCNDESRYIFFYDLKRCGWSKIPVPEESQSSDMNPWKAAVVGDDLYFMNLRLHLYRLGNGQLQRIKTEINEIYEMYGFYSCLTAVHRWLYIFTALHDGPKNLEVYCYDTESGFWTDIQTDFTLREHGTGFESSIMFENKIYFVSHLTGEEFAPTLYEYNLCDDSIEESSRYYPWISRFYVDVIDVATKMLKGNSEAEIYQNEREKMLLSENSDSDGDT